MPEAPTRSQVRQRLADHLPGLAAGMLREILDEVPSYDDVSVRPIDVPAVIERNLALVARLLREERLPQPSEVAFVVGSTVNPAADPAEEQVPLTEVLAACFAGFRWCWQQAVELVGERELYVAGVAELALSYLESVTISVTEAYVEASAALAGRDREARAVLLRRVLEGSAQVDDWAAVNMEPWDVCSVVSLRLSPSTAADEVTGAVEARRRVAAVRDCVTRVTGGAALDDLGPTGGTVVLRGAARREQVAAHLHQLLGAGWHAGLAVAHAADDVPEAAVAAHDCAEVAERLGHPAGVHKLADLVLEVQVTRPGPARTALGNLLMPLTEHPELLETLRAHVAADGRRAEAAASLHVHPNTLDYRLRRVRELIGTDPMTRDGGQMVRAALLVRRYLAEPRRTP